MTTLKGAQRQELPDDLPVSRVTGADPGKTPIPVNSTTGKQMPKDQATFNAIVWQYLMGEDPTGFPP